MSQDKTISMIIYVLMLLAVIVDISMNKLCGVLCPQYWGLITQHSIFYLKTRITIMCVEVVGCLPVRISLGRVRRTF